MVVGAAAASERHSVIHRGMTDLPPIFAAAVAGDVDQVRLLLDSSPLLVAERLPGSESTPLHEAAWHGRAEVIRLLLDRGADVNAEAALHETPLAYLRMGQRFSARDAPLDGARKHEYAVTAQLLEERGGVDDS